MTGEPLKEIKRQAVDAIEKRDWRTLETEYPDMPENLWEPYLSRRFVLGAHLYGSLGINRDNKAGRLETAKRNFQFFNAPVGLFITIDRGLGPSRWADLGGYVSTLALLARGYGLDSCPQVMWIRVLPFQTCAPICELISRRVTPGVTQGLRAGAWVAHRYPFEDVANAKIVVHLAGLLRRMV